MGLGFIALTMTACISVGAETDRSAPKVACPDKLIPPYSGPLTIESKYDQSDSSKSTLKESRSAESERIYRQIQTFSKQLVGYSDRYVRSDNEAYSKVALACFDQSLSNWAEADALMSEDASKNGQAMRKWTLAAVASAARKLTLLSDGQYELSSKQELWLRRLASKVKSDYQPRLTANFKGINNHDYWAGWAVTVTGMLLNDGGDRQWGYQAFDHAMGQIESEQKGDLSVGWLPNEMGRRHLATEYTQYALLPLVFLAVHADANDHPLTSAQRSKLMALVNMATMMMIYPEKVRSLLSDDQKIPEGHKLAWLVPWLHAYPDNAVARELYDHFKGEVDGYSQAGGLIEAIYPVRSATSEPRPNKPSKVGVR